MATKDADVRNAHTPRTEEAREAIAKQLSEGHGTVETGDPTTAVDFDPVQLEVQERMQGRSEGNTSAASAPARKSSTRSKRKSR